ncbi:MAG: Glutamate 5-kinase [Brockia lithotrophica]|uniref:Glutamate 5-kinase n=1 Tax=Brockia lithotrophica TaxID=933949 RepID=A0A2T5G642_9BACL|nr:MAG: Glutamate 5-kinase [Brockia lithotrophica]
MGRELIRAYRRIVVKVGTHSLTDERGELRYEKFEQVVADVADAVRTGHEVILVSSGAIALGAFLLGWRRDLLTLPEKQAAAAVGQTQLMKAYAECFAERGLAVGQILLTRDDLDDRRRYVHLSNTLETLLRHRILPIVNENDSVAVEEIRVGDNDTLAAALAGAITADLVALLTDVEGLYDQNPRLHPDARLISEVHELTPEIWALAEGAGTSVGTGGMRTKLEAAHIATSMGVDLVVLRAGEGRLGRFLAGEPVGTLFHRRPAPRGKKRWLQAVARPSGTLVVDDGAVDALVRGKKSLLVPGVRRVEGTFEEGDVVLVVSEDGLPVAKGLVRYASEELRLLLQRKATGQSVARLPEVVHRDELVLVERVANAPSDA